MTIAQPSVGQDTRFDKAVSDIEPYEFWNEVTVNSRQRQLIKLARVVWDVPNDHSPNFDTDLQDSDTSSQNSPTHNDRSHFKSMDCDTSQPVDKGDFEPKRWKAGIPVREVVWNAVQELTNGDKNFEFAIKDLKPIIQNKHPNFKMSNLGPEVYAYCANSPSRKHYISAGNLCYYWQISKGKYRLYDEERDR